MSTKYIVITLVAVLVWFFYNKNQPKERVLTSEEQIAQNHMEFKNKKENVRSPASVEIVEEPVTEQVSEVTPETLEKKTRADFADQIQDAEEELVRDQLVICEFVTAESKENADYDSMMQKREEAQMQSFANVSNGTVMDESLVNNEEEPQVPIDSQVHTPAEHDNYKKLYRRSRCPEGDRVTEATENDLLERLEPEQIVSYLIKRERLENLIKDPVNNDRTTYNFEFYQSKLEWLKSQKKIHIPN